MINTVGECKFQSTPAITGERAWRRCENTSCCCGFNPRPPLLASEPLSIMINTVAECKFQSTPAITGERAGVKGSAVAAAGVFQSTPAITGERAGRTAKPAYSETGFNPRPPLLASEPRDAGGCA